MLLTVEEGISGSLELGFTVCVVSGRTGVSRRPLESELQHFFF